MCVLVQWNLCFTTTEFYYLVFWDQNYGTNVAFYAKIHLYFMTTCHLRPTLLEPKGGRKTQVLLYFEWCLA